MVGRVITRAITLLFISVLLICTACTKPKPKEAEKEATPQIEEVSPTVQPIPGQTVVSVQEIPTSAQAPVSEVTVMPLPTTEVPVVPLPTSTLTPTAVLTSLLTATPTPEEAPAPPEVPITHLVRRGETLISIGRQYGIPWQDIARANEIASPYWIVVGQKLIIPQEGAAVAPPEEEKRTHIVQRGENLFRIGLKYGVDWRDIARANGITDPTKIFVGQKLVIP